MKFKKKEGGVCVHVSIEKTRKPKKNFGKEDCPVAVTERNGDGKSDAKRRLANFS